MDLDTRARSAAQGILRAVEVMEMSTDTQQPRKVERFDRYQQRKSRNRRTGALAVAAAIVIALVAAATSLLPSSTAPASNSPAPIPPGTAFTVNLDTGVMTPLPAPIATQGNDFAISPAGDEIAYTDCCGAPLHVANLDGTNDRIITPAGLAGIGPQWSPDGSTLVYQLRDPLTQKLGNIFAYDVRTGSSRRLTNIDQSQSWGWWMLFPSFSPSARPLSVDYQLPRGNPNRPVWDIWEQPVAGGQPTVVRPNAGWGASSASLSWGLAFVSPVDPRTFSGNAIRISGQGDYPEPSSVVVSGRGITWLRTSPDESQIAYQQGNYVYVVDASPGARPSRVAAGSSPEWVDGATLVIGPNN
jgi:hypothetical protein